MAKLTMFAQAFRTPDLRKKLLFTLGIIVLFRFGSALPAPGISAANVRYCSGLASGSGSAAAHPGRAEIREIRWNPAPPCGIERVVRRARGAGREAEFTEFAGAASATLLRAALVLLNSREEAEDALQLTLLRTFRRWDRAREAPEAYSRTVLVNVCRERWRHRKRHPEVTGVLADISERAVVTSFADAVDRRHVLVRVLRRLPAVQREVLVFRYLLDASVAETAAALGIAEGTVKSAASRGLDQLRMLLSAEYEDKKVRRVHPR